MLLTHARHYLTIFDPLNYIHISVVFVTVDEKIIQAFIHISNNLITVLVCRTCIAQVFTTVFRIALKMVLASIRSQMIKF